MTWGNPPRSPLPADVWHVPCTPAFRQAHIARGSHGSSLPVLRRRDFIIQWKCPDWETGHFLGSVPVPAPRTVLSRCCAAPSCSQCLGEAERRVPGSDTAPPWVTCRIPRNLGILPPPLQPCPSTFTPCFRYSPVLGSMSPFWVAGSSPSYGGVQ